MDGWWDGRLNHNPYFYINDELLKTGLRIYGNVVMDFLSGKL
jgi:hypothetical protein